MMVSILERSRGRDWLMFLNVCCCLRTHTTIILERIELHGREIVFQGQEKVAGLRRAPLFTIMSSLGKGWLWFLNTSSNVGSLSNGSILRRQMSVTFELAPCGMRPQFPSVDFDRSSCFRCTTSRNRQIILLKHAFNRPRSDQPPILLSRLTAMGQQIVIRL